jgi:hypothetical protein
MTSNLYLFDDILPKTITRFRHNQIEQTWKTRNEQHGHSKKSLNIPKVQSEAVNSRRRDNPITKIKEDKDKQRSTKKLHRKLKIEQHKPHLPATSGARRETGVGGRQSLFIAFKQTTAYLIHISHVLNFKACVYYQNFI